MRKPLKTLRVSAKVEKLMKDKKIAVAQFASSV